MALQSKQVQLQTGKMMTVYYPLPQSIVNSIATIDDEENKEWRLLGVGEYGQAFEHHIHDSYILKRFNQDMYNVETDEDNHLFDYEVLTDLQGINAFPLLYGYVEREYVVMSRARGVALTELQLTPELLLSIDRKVEHAVEQCIIRGWYPEDLMARHVFYNEEFDCIDIIDFGKYQEVKSSD